MRYLLFLFLLASTTLRAATGDILSVAVLANGWQADVVVSGVNIGGTYDFGWSGIAGCPLATNAITGAEKFKLTVTSPGYDASGNTTTYTWSIYGTHQIRKAYPSASLNEESFSSPNATVRIGLSDFVGPSDTITAVVAGGFYTQSGTPNNAVTGLSVVNNSTTPYGKVVGNTTMPAFNRITASTYTFRIWAAHEGAHQGMTLPCVKVIAADQHSHSTTVTLTKMSKPDTTLNDAIGSAEYQAVVDLSAMTAGDPIRFDWKAYPWRGTSTEVIDTTLNTYSMPHVYACSVTNLYDPNNTYGGTYAVVDGIGPDSGGLAICTNSDPTLIPTTLYFSSLAAATKAIAATNSISKGHADYGGSTIYLKGTTSYYSNAATSIGARPYTWLTITNYPGQQGSISNSAGNASSQPNLVKFDGLLINPQTGANNIFFTASNKWAAWWFNNCDMSSPNATLITDSASVDNYSLVYVTGCRATNWAQGFVPQGGSLKVCHSIIRGNNLSGFSKSIRPYVMMGNNHPNTNGFAFTIAMDAASMGTPNPDQYALVYNNYLGGFAMNPAGSCFLMNQSYDISNGVAIVQNVFEHCTNNGGNATFDFGSHNSRNYTNMLIWGNVVVGTKTFFAYNDTGSSAAWRVRWSVKNNIIDDFNIKSDVFTGGSGANGARIGNWAVLYGCGFSGNAFLETGSGGNPPGLGAPGNFLLEWCGLNTISTNVASGSNGWTNSPSYAQFFDRQAYDGASGGIFPGGGNYRLLSSSPLHNLKQEVLLPYGLNGLPRGEGVPNTACFEPPGPYATGGPRKGGGFF